MRRCARGTRGRHARTHEELPHGARSRPSRRRRVRTSAPTRATGNAPRRVHGSTSRADPAKRSPRSPPSSRSRDPADQALAEAQADVPRERRVGLRRSPQHQSVPSRNQIRHAWHCVASVVSRTTPESIERRSGPAPIVRMMPYRYARSSVSRGSAVIVGISFDRPVAPARLVRREHPPAPTTVRRIVRKAQVCSVPIYALGRYAARLVRQTRYPAILWCCPTYSGPRP